MADNSAETDASQTAPETQNEDISAIKAELEKYKREAARYQAESQSERNGRLQAEQRGMSETERRIASDESACKASIDSLNGEADSIESEIARLADEPGHGAEIAKLNRRLATVINKAQTEEQRATWLAGQREQAKAKAAEATSDAADKPLANGSPTDKMPPVVKAWLQKHPQCFTDKVYLSKVISLSGYARDIEGIEENSPEFFDYVDERLNGTPAQTARQQAAPDPDGEDLTGELDHTVKNPQTRAAGPGAMRQAMVAPPSRGAVTAPGSAPRRQALLSADEREVADKLYAEKFKNPADRYAHYAKNKQYLKDTKRHGFGAN